MNLNPAATTPMRSGPSHEPSDHDDPYASEASLGAAMTRPLAIAHRGYSARYPENSLLAVERAVAAGSDLVEADARLAADGSVWCVHDADLQRLAGIPLRVAEADAAALAGVVLQSGERLATLDRLLGQVAGRVPVLIDVKTTGLDIARAVLRTVADEHREEIWFGFRSAAQIAEVRGLAGQARCLGFLPAYEEAPAFAAAGAQAVRVWEGHMDQPAAARLFGHPMPKLKDDHPRRAGVIWDLLSHCSLWPDVDVDPSHPGYRIWTGQHRATGDSLWLTTLKWTAASSTLP